MRDDSGGYDDDDDAYDTSAPDAEAWLGDLLDAAAAEYEPDTERLRALVAARIAASPDELADPVHPADPAAQTGPAGHASGRPHRARKRPRAHGSGGQTRPGSRPRRLAVLGRIGLAGIPAGVALATIGAAAALAVGATATIAVTSNHDRPTTVPVVTPNSGGPGGGPPSQSPPTSPSARATVGGGATKPSAPGTHPSPGGSTTAPGGSTTATGSGGSNQLFSVTTQIDPHSNPSWTELNIWVAAKQPLTSLTVTIKVADCANLASDSEFDDGGGDRITATEATGADGSITYTFVLKPGKTLNPAGQPIEFAGQFTHAASGWTAVDDTYVVGARTAASAADTVARGAF
jgi:hypothetical protein